MEFDYEKLGAFYLGRTYDLAQNQSNPAKILYDSKDLTTHAVCVGMTGSGKTGLCVSLLEEAAIDGVPAIAIDPKGDLANLMLTFPDLAADDFRPWIDESEAARKGKTPDQFAADVATRWRDGLASWDQAPDRVRRFSESVDRAIYTPGSSAGLPLTVLRSFDPPSEAVLNDADAFRERVSSAASGILSLLGIDADPVRSREHILVANLLDRAWREGRRLDIAGLIREIQSPPFTQVGVVDLDTFFPAKDRVELAMSLNSLLASPSFASWLEGEPLDIKRLLYTPAGKPRLSILSIAHLSEPERMFFVTILLNEVLSWVRSQPGTSSLRALLFMDEVFGFFPPTANPPSKKPMLTLLKQARAYGLGVILATQNPVDLDYKGLSNTGTWFLGRLQTERDKMRVLEGLEGASLQAGSTFDKGQMEATLASLQSRVFVMNNVHEDQPVIFQTRWALSYLRGPLTRSQIQTLMADRRAAQADPAAPAPVPAETLEPAPPSAPVTEAAPPSASKSGARAQAPLASPSDARSPDARPLVAADVPERFLARSGLLFGDARIIYRPALLGQVKLHFVKSTYQVDTWRERTLLACSPPEADPQDLWESAQPVEFANLDLRTEPESGATFARTELPLSSTKAFTRWRKQLQDFAYQQDVLSLWKCPALKETSRPDETEGDFRVRLTQAAKEQRDLEIEKLRSRFADQVASLQKKMATVEKRIARETSQYQKARRDTAVSIGSSVLGALLGRKMASRTNLSKASTSMRSASRAAEQREDVVEAEKQLAELKQEQQQLEKQLEAEIDAMQQDRRPESFELEEVPIRPRKSDIDVERLTVVWTPWIVDATGQALPGYSTDGSRSGLL